ncbi:MAG: aminotransferase class V-fold PLP-dependent enzyme [Pseudomonadota bacterium]
MVTLDVDWVRDQFPAFSEPDLVGQAFFENAGGSYTCRQVIDRLSRFYSARKVQPYAPYQASRLGGAEMDQAQSRLAALLNIAEDELSFGPSTTQNAYVLAQAFRQMMAPGDAIIVTNQDHEANSGAWRRLADEGIDVREWRVDPETGRLHTSELEALLDGRVRLVCFPHCSNIVAEINPVADWTAIAQKAGAVVCVDGVSYAPHGLPDIGGLGADIYMFSSYKTYGPHQGILVVRQPLASMLPNQGHYFNAETATKRFTPAGPDHAQVAASAGMADYVDAVYAHHFNTAADAATRGRVVHDLMRDHEIALLGPLLAYANSHPRMRVVGPTDAKLRAPTVALSLDMRGEDAAAALAPLGIMAGGGDFYAVRLLEALGIPPDHGVLRLSFTHYTTQAEIDQLTAALDQVI